MSYSGRLPCDYSPLFPVPGLGWSSRKLFAVKGCQEIYCRLVVVAIKLTAAF